MTDAKELSGPKETSGPRVGITGSRHGCNGTQLSVLRELLTKLAPSELHHGDCFGVDSEAHYIAAEMLPSPRIVVHPPSNPSRRAMFDGDELRRTKDYHARNRDIVDEADLLIGVPAKPHHEGGGTWYTIDYARRTGKPHHIIMPTGQVLTRPAPPLASRPTVTENTRTAKR